MIYTVRFCHLSREPKPDIGGSVRRGDLIGYMGNTGKSNGAHLHIDCVEGRYSKPWRLSEMESGLVSPAYKQLNYFIDSELFGCPPLITTYFNDPAYTVGGKLKVHLAYDLVPSDRHETNEHFNIFWNRRHQGIVVGKGYDSGYGNYMNISFAVEC